MPTQKPRATLTLEPQTMQLLDRLSEAQGVSKSDVVQGLLEAARGPLERVVVIVEAARRQPALSLEQFKVDLLAAEKVILPNLESTMWQLDWLAGSLGAAPGKPPQGNQDSERQRASASPRASRAAPATTRKKPGPVKDAPRPPLSNRGVTPPGGEGKKGAGQGVLSPAKVARIDDARSRRGSKP